MNIIFYIGYWSLRLWLHLTRKQVEKETGATITELSITVSEFPVSQKMEILINGEPYLND
jgi:hypothetical protein